MILEEKHKIELETVAMCIVSTGLKGQVRGYNKVVQEFIKQKYEKKFLTEVREQAKEQHNQIFEKSTIKWRRKLSGEVSDESGVGK